jgi:isopenicillin N synthase-like dioxygenase
MEVPRIDIAPLFGPRSAARDEIDMQILAAGERIGFLTVTGYGTAAPLDSATRAQLLRIFDLPESSQRRLWRAKFAPENRNLYRGWFPLQQGDATFKEGIDIGPDLVRPVARQDDPLCEQTPLPIEAELPGWRGAASAYYARMETIGLAMMRAIARALGLAENFFDRHFAAGISTFRLIRYPARDASSLAGIAASRAEGDAKGRHLTGAAHADSGFVTLLAQDGVEGLQARAHDGRWFDVPPEESTLAINFGRVLERWTAGRIRATEHRVVGHGAERRSIPFFFEPAVDAVIAPLPLAGAAQFEPFAYGDHLWSSMTKFLEFRGLENARRPTGVRTS